MNTAYFGLPKSQFFEWLPEHKLLNAVEEGRTPIHRLADYPTGKTSSIESMGVFHVSMPKSVPTHGWWKVRERRDELLSAAADYPTGIKSNLNGIDCNVNADAPNMRSEKTPRLLSS